MDLHSPSQNSMTLERGEAERANRMATTVVEERKRVLVRAGVLTNISSIISHVIAPQTSDDPINP